MSDPTRPRSRAGSGRAGAQETMMKGNYILVDGEPVQEPDILKWGRWLEDADRVVARLKIAEGVEVSTVFLGLDHSFTNDGPPLLYETMVFGGSRDQEMERYATLEDAQHGHDRMVARARGDNV